MIPTYRGLAWTTPRDVTELRAELEVRLIEGETSTVDLKRKLILETASDKAEFVNYLTALANTPGAGKRFLLIGVENNVELFSPRNGTECVEQRRAMFKLN